MLLKRLSLPLAVMVCIALGFAALTGIESASASKGRVFKLGGKHRPAQATTTAGPSPTVTATPTASATPTATASPTAAASPTTTTTAPTDASLDPIASGHLLTLTRDGEQLQSPYCSNGTLTETYTAVSTVVIVVHGDSRTACDQARYVAEAAGDRGQLGQTLIVAPRFLTVDDAEAATAGRLYWSDGGWKSGSPSLVSPYLRPTTVSSYDVLDAFVERATSTQVLPDLQRVVIAGHSAGGQLVNRYAASAHVDVGRAGVSLRYVVANPSSYLYFDNRRPDAGGFRTLTAAEVSACSSYNKYKYGLDKLNAYASTSPQPLPTRYAGARVDYLLGELDTDRSDSSLDTTCAANWQGTTRLARGSHYFQHLGTVLGDSVYDRQQLTVVPGVGHSAHDMFTSAVGARTLFP